MYQDMLPSTYMHIPSVGRTTEKRIWASGIRTWYEFIEQEHEAPVSAGKRKTIMEGIEHSICCLDSGDSEFFARSLPGSEHWRAFHSFSDSVAYVDIETTGLSPEHSCITVIGIYDGKDARAYVRGDNIEEVADELSKYRYLVTFNGSRFDLPFIKKEFPEIEFDQLHLDLMYPLKRIGLKGGLKLIEQELGISRSDETCGITGFDAVRLWHEHERGCDGALDTLLEYNREDIVNLETIVEMIYPELVRNAFDGK